MEYFLGFLVLLLSVALGFSLYFLVKCGRMLINMTDAIAQSLDTLDASYNAIGEILKTPVGSDDPFIRDVIEEISRSQRAILVVANLLTADWHAPVDETDDNYEEEDEDDE